MPTGAWTDDSLKLFCRDKGNEAGIEKNYNTPIVLLIKCTKKAHQRERHETSEMESSNSSRDCEVSTYTQSSGYNSSTASSSLNYIDEDHLSTVIDASCAKKIDRSDNNRPITKLIITITLVRIEEKVFSSSL